MKRRMRAVLAVVMLSALLLGTSASAVLAQTPINREYRLNTQGQADGGGYARAVGDLTWYNKHEFAISGKVKDVCPGDGNGAKFGLWIAYRRGEWTWHHLGSDTDGCDTPGRTFSRSFDRDRRITKVRLFLCENEGGTDTCVGFRMRDKDNPFTG
jgi:hypothetical protein